MLRGARNRDGSFPPVCADACENCGGNQFYCTVRLRVTANPPRPPLSLI